MNKALNLAFQCKTWAANEWFSLPLSFQAGAAYWLDFSSGGHAAKALPAMSRRQGGREGKIQGGPRRLRLPTPNRARTAFC